MKTVKRKSMDWLDISDRVEFVKNILRVMECEETVWHEGTPRSTCIQFYSPNGLPVCHVYEQGGELKQALLLKHFHEYYGHFAETRLEGIVREGEENIRRVVEDVIKTQSYIWQCEIDQKQRFIYLKGKGA